MGTTCQECQEFGSDGVDKLAKLRVVLNNWHSDSDEAKIIYLEWIIKELKGTL